MNVLYQIRRYAPASINLKDVSRGEVQSLKSNAALQKAHHQATQQSRVLLSVTQSLSVAESSLRRDVYHARHAFEQVSLIAEKMAFIEATLSEASEQGPVRTIKTPQGSTGGIRMAADGTLVSFSSSPSLNRVYQAGLRLNDKITHVNGLSRAEGNLTTIWNSYVSRNPEGVMQLNFIRDAVPMVAMVQIRDVSIYETKTQEKRYFSELGKQVLQEVRSIWDNLRSRFDVNGLIVGTLIGNAHPRTQSLPIGFEFKTGRVLVEDMEVQNYARMIQAIETTLSQIESKGFMTEGDLASIEAHVSEFRGAYEIISRQSDKITFAREFSRTLSETIGAGAIHLIEADLGEVAALLKAEEVRKSLTSWALPLFSASSLEQDLRVIRSVSLRL